MTTPRRGRSLTDAASSIAPTEENTSHPVAVADAERGGVVGVDDHLVAACQTDAGRASSLSHEFIE